MQRWGAVPVDVKGTNPTPGDLVAVPFNNTNVIKLPPDVFARLERLDFGVLAWLTTMRPERGAGFHGGSWGPLPFAFGRVPKETYDVVRFVGSTPR
jgi:hypothetical protein